jgi:hypothetical protein
MAVLVGDAHAHVSEVGFCSNTEEQRSTASFLWPKDIHKEMFPA